MKTFQTLTIQFNCDNLLLQGTLHLPKESGEQVPCIIGSHGLFSDSSSPKQIALANECNARNIAWFRFDHRGCGQSEGDFKTVTTIENRCRDFKAAIDVVQKHHQIGEKIAYFGSSLGGSIALLAGISSSPQAIVTLAAPISMNAVWEVLVKNEQDQLLGNEFYKEAIQFDIIQQLKTIQNILIFHGSKDEVVPLSNANLIYEKASKPKKLFVLDGGCHRLSDTKHQAIFIRNAVDWFDIFF
jgi:esterase/lipase